MFKIEHTVSRSPGGTKKLRNRGSSLKSSKPRKSPSAAKARQKGRASGNRIRAGTKQAGLIEILRRSMGATIQDLAKADRLAGPFRARRHLGRAEEKARHDGGVGEDRERRAALPLGGVAPDVFDKHPAVKLRHDGDGHGDPVVIAGSITMQPFSPKRLAGPFAITMCHCRNGRISSNRQECQFTLFLI